MCYAIGVTLLLLFEVVSKGNPNWTRKYGEPTKVVRLPISLADEILEKLKAEVPVDEILQQLASVLIKEWRQLPERPGIYFIHRDSHLLYVGQSSNLRRRLAEHYKQGRFNRAEENVRVAWFEYDVESRPDVERSLIQLLMPQTPAETESKYETKITIVQAIAQVMRMAGKPLEVSEIYQTIVKNNLYKFKADDPVHIVRGQIRRHCEGLDFPSASSTKYFVITKDGKYWLKDVSLGDKTEVESKNLEIEKIKVYEENLIKEIKANYEKYLANFKVRVLQHIAILAPDEFESFSRKLLDAFGFQNIKITERYEDGGIKGYGDCELSDIDFLQYAFQVRRSNNAAIQPSDINEFRGSIDGEFRQGMFFTTSEFTDKAKEIAGKRGAIPIALVDGSRMVDRMIAQKLGIEKIERIKGVSTYSIVLEDITYTNGYIKDK